jgi:hypothetical protein
MNKNGKIIDKIINGCVLETSMFGLAVTLVSPIIGCGIVAGALLATLTIIYLNE